MDEKITRISQLKPEAVFHFFEEISRIPRPSHQEEKISNYLAQFARQRGLFYVQDDLYNIVIVKDATTGYEDQPTVILQGHMDMVCEKEADCEKDMEQEGLGLVTDGKEVWAKGTTLGGDDGIAVAYALAILDADDIAHPRLEFVCTVCEEVGMDGAAGLDTSCLQGRRLINLDSEEEGIFLAGCAGGCTADIRLPAEETTISGVVLELEISGLLGGHSGTEIDKGRANANVLMLEWLERIYQTQSFAIVSMAGGSKDNAIPRSCICRIVIPETQIEGISEMIQQAASAIKADWQQAEPGISFQNRMLGNKSEDLKEKALWEGKAVGVSETGKLLKELRAFPNGVIAMCKEPAGLVETSLNLGVLRITEGAAQLRYSVRSCVDYQLELLTDQLAALARQGEGTMDISGKYPAWEYQGTSAFREKLAAVYERMYHKKPQIQVIHAGLECGILASKLPGLECVSMGPDIYDIHTPAERMDVASVQRTYAFVLEVLAQKD